MIIYKATNLINGKIYIGQTTKSIKRRKAQHEQRSKYDKYLTLFGKALRKYGFDNFEWKIIDYADTKRELDLKESLWILVFHATDKNRGYNLKGGGSDQKMTNRVKLKISSAQKGELNHMYGKKGKDNPCSIKVINVTKNINYDSATECAEKEYINVSKVCAVCRGDRATTNNCVYRYVVDEKIQEVQPKLKRKSISVINLDTGEKFNSIKEAQKKYDHNTKDALIQALKRGNGACVWRGYRWKYENLTIDPETINKKARSDAKRVMNVTTGQIFPSISSIGKNYRNLATALRKGNGECYYQKQSWKILK